MTLVLLCSQQTKDLRYSTQLLNKKFEKMSKAKKAIVCELGFGGLMHISPMNVPHKLLKELANSFNLDKNKLDTARRFQGKTLKNLTDQMMDIGVDND
ncbi:hypothetical protein Ahy_A04g019008 isoform B [Arachis hypogaea]|uniref:Uncharacterized protein n=1 Tax=Arachis hypogaea TaxID=3818 RepID=A0A445DF54_ARAHY|nr:hypothetical protein Ahy_A04g019008 isoform B [Arachis hypogaea]